MARKYARNGFRSSAKGMWHRDADGQDPLARTRISPEQAKLLVSIGLMATCGLYIAGLLFSKVHNLPDTPPVHAVATVVSKAVEDGDRFYLVLDVPRDEGDPVRAKVRVDETEWRSFEPADRVGVSYRLANDSVDVETLYRVERGPDSVEPVPEDSSPEEPES